MTHKQYYYLTKFSQENVLFMFLLNYFLFKLEIIASAIMSEISCVMNNYH